jgi:alpha-tubulin suppressor-like RCC1 family protein
MRIQDRILKLVLWVLVTLSLGLTSCGGREEACPTSPLLVAGDAHPIAIKNDGTLWIWGSNGFGQFGNGTNTKNYAPIQIGQDTEWDQYRRAESIP